MKKCGYCGHENVEYAIVCCECGTSLASERENTEFEFAKFLVWWRKPLPTSLKNILWWGLVIAAWLYISPAAIICLPLFAAGLVGQSLLVFVIWAFYIAITVFGLRAKTRWGYFLFYSIFSYVIILNAVGCRRILHDLSQVK